MDRALSLFAEVLSYPKEDLPALARECEKAASAAGFPSAPLQEFRAFVEAAPLGKLEELYASFFDPEGNSGPYVGYHLYGDGYARSLFLLELQKKYRACGFEPGPGLADHLCVILRYLADCDDRDAREELVTDALLPALHTMIEKCREPGATQETGPRAAPYWLVLQSLCDGLKGD